MKKSKGLLSKIVTAVVCVSMVFNVFAGQALADENEVNIPICGIEEHVHEEQCFDGDELICGLEEHTHVEACFEEAEEALEPEETEAPEETEESEEAGFEENPLYEAGIDGQAETAIITALQVRLGDANGPVVRDLLDDSDRTPLNPDTDYYLYVELKNPAVTGETAYVSIDFGTEDGKANGLTFFNPPGGSTLIPGAFVHNYLDTLVSYTDNPNPAYGATTNKLTLVDGKIVYTVKPIIAHNADISFATGLIISQNYCSSSILDAFRIKVGTVSDGSYNEMESVSADIYTTYSPAFIQYHTNAPSGTIDASSIFGLRIWSGSSANIPITYDTVNIKLKLPEGCVLEDYGFGYNSVGAKTNATLGTIFIDVDNPTIEDGYAIYDVTISNGYKAPSSTIDYSVKLSFPRSAFTEASTNVYKTQLLPATIEAAAGGTIDIEKADAKNITIYDPEADATTVGPQTRTVYNPTIQTEPGTYMTLLGDCSISNPSSSESPYDKTYEAHYNVTNTAAVTTAVTVPKGSIADPIITYTGIDESGAEVSGTVTAAQSAVKNQVYYLFKASDLGIKSFTSITAEVGKLTAGYLAETWNANWSFGSCRAGSYGYFTTDEVGIQVRNTYSIYNSDPLLREIKNGDLSTYSLSTTTDVASDSLNITMNQNGNIKNDANKNTDSFTAGNNVNIVSGMVNAYSVPGSSTSTGSDRGTASMVVDPVMYLTLPTGITYSSLEFWDYEYNETDGNIGKTQVSYEIENVSHLNTTGDGVSIFKITFPSVNAIGYYDANGHSHRIYYTVRLATGRTLETKRYAINDLIQISSATTNFTGMKYTSGTTTVSDTLPDKYGINGGKNLAGAAAPSNPDVGFGIQGLSEIMVSNAIRVSKINNVAVEQESWFTYDESDPNSIALLGLKSEGIFRVVLKNPGALLEATDFRMFIPIPKDGTDLGMAFQDEAFEFDMDMSWDDAELSAALPGLAAKYVKISGTYENIQANNVTYEECSADEANAVMLTFVGDFPDNSEIALNFNFVVDGDIDDLGEVNVWRNAYYYVCDLDPNGKSLVGDRVASEIAGGSVKGCVFYDINSNGMKEAADTAVSGVSVVLKDRNNKIYSTTTDDNGEYEFLAVREETISLTMKADSSMGQRFNVNPIAATDGIICSTVNPSADGMSADITLEVQEGVYEVNGAMSKFYTVSYNGNGNNSGVLPKSKEYAADATATVSVKPDSLVKNGYAFTGWNTKADGSGTAYAPGATFAVSEDVTLYAQWTPATFNIIFNYTGATGGNDIASKQVVYKQTYGGDGVWPVPVKNGYNFRDWGTNNPVNTTSLGTTIRSNSTVNITQDTTLYAWWNAKTGYKVIYDSNGGSELENKTVAWTDSVLPTESPVKNGYDFAGWTFGSSKVAAGTAYSKLAVNDDVAEITLIAQWTPKTGYTVNYNTDGGSEIESLANVSWTQSGLLPQVSPVKEGYALSGWIIGEDSAVNSTSTYGDLAVEDTVESIELKAVWVESQYNTVHYDTDGGSFVSDKVNVQNGDAGLIPDAAPVKAGYEFMGWQFGDTEVTAETTYESLSTETEITLKAIWADKYYLVNYVTNTDDEDGAFTVGYYSAGLIPEIGLTKAGYTLDGWYLSGTATKVDDTTVYSSLAGSDNVESITIEAIWNVKTGYVVGYNANGGTTVAQKTGLSWTSANLTDASSTRTGYTFAGWTYKGSAVSATDTYGQLAGNDAITNITLTADWTAKGGYSVKYDTNGGSAIDDLTGVKWNQTSLIPDDIPVKAGYTFDHWACGRKTNVSASDTFGSMASGDAEGTYITLNAVYTVNSGYKVTYNTNGGTPTTVVARENLKWTDVNLVPTGTFAKTGYDFAGWECNGIDVTDATHYYDLCGGVELESVELTAKWTEKSAYTVKYDLNGGSGNFENKTGVKWTDNSLLPDSYPVWTGHMFTGWTYDDIEVLDAQTYGDIAVTDDISEITLVAVWEDNIYRVEFDTDGGSDIDPMQIRWDEIATPSVIPVKNGYVFDMWTIDGNDVAQGTKYSELVSNDSVNIIKLKARWNDKSGFTVKYDLNGADGEIEPIANVYWTENNLLPEENPTRRGYTFDHWEFEGEEVDRESTYEELAEDDSTSEITLKAIWIPRTYIVGFDGNGADGGSMDSITMVYDVESKLPENQFTKEGYEFTSWNTEADGSGTTYADEAIVKNLFGFEEADDGIAFFSLAEDDDVVLYAQWKEAEKEPEPEDPEDPENPDDPKDPDDPKPENPEKPNKPDKPNKPVDDVKTGDSSMPMAWAAALIASLLALIAIVIIMKRRERE